VGAPSKGTIFPKHRGDLLEAAVVVQRMEAGLIEHTRYLRNPLDVLAQQIVAMVALDPMDVDAVRALVRKCACFAELTEDVFTNTLDLLAGRYPSEEFGELRPRVVWDRMTGSVRGRDGAQRLAITNAGTIPDRGLFGVFLADGTRVGELDEEMVYESRAGETFLLGASTWRIEDITFERVVVSPAPGQPGKMPFWHGDRPGRPLELGRAIGSFVRETRAMPDDKAAAKLRDDHSLDAWAADNLVRYLREQAEATGVCPDDRTIVIERFRDEIGDWRICVLAAFGTPVLAPWAMCIQAKLEERFGVPVEAMWSDDGIVIRLPEAIDRLDLADVLIEPTELDELIVTVLPSTSLFAARFRECAARALLLPKRRPDRRTPLWQQRQRAADLLAVASKYPSFPILLETSRECLQDVFDVPALRQMLAELQSRTIRVSEVETQSASPFAQSLMFGWIGAYMYEGDAPMAERRAAALSLDRDLLRELLGSEELRELLDADVIADLELELQRLADGRRARNTDEVHDLLRWLGDLSALEIDQRSESGVAGPAIDALVAERRAFWAKVGGDDRLLAADDASKYRDGIGVSLPVGLPTAFTDPIMRPLEELVARYARTHAPFVVDAAVRRFGVPHDRILGALRALEADGRVIIGEFRPDGVTREWCDPDVLRQLRRRSLASLRREVEPVEPEALARFQIGWHHLDRPRKGFDALVESIGQLQGVGLLASAMEHDLLAARVERFSVADLDALCTGGELVWVGAGPVGSSDGRVALYFRDQIGLLHEPGVLDGGGDLHEAIRLRLAQHGACFWPQLQAAAPHATEAELLGALWDLVWAGEVTNDTLAPLRSFVRGKVGKAAGTKKPGRPRPGRLTRLGPPAGAGRWSLVTGLLEPRPSATERAHALTLQLLERYGVVTREMVLAEGILGGFAAVYPLFKELEERGQVRRGYFVAGQGAAQFSLVGAVDRLRAVRDRDPDATATMVPATDPAQPYGAALAWPSTDGRPTRTAGASVVMLNGLPLVWIDRIAHHLVTFASSAVDDPIDDRVWIDAIAAQVSGGRWQSVEIRKVNGTAIVDHPLRSVLLAHGFKDAYKGVVLRR
jgi:ATP-dependent helicase Lhr and Lhr-like helicase